MEQATIHVQCKCGQEFENISQQTGTDRAEFIVATLWSMLQIRTDHLFATNCGKQTKAAWVQWADGTVTSLDLKGNLVDDLI